MQKKKGKKIFNKNDYIVSCITNLGKARRLVAEPTSKNRSFINLHVLLRKRRSDIEGMQTRELFYKHLQRLRFQ